VSDPSDKLVRQARPEEYPELTRIWKAAVEATHDFVTPEEIAGWEARMPTDFLPAVELTVATDAEDRPLGFIGLDGNKIEMLFVDPAAHGRGTGRELVEHVALDNDELKVDVNEENMGAVAFYWKVGFSPAGRSELDGEGNPHPLLHLQRMR
jgi:putative acetyltransferase